MKETTKSFQMKDESFTCEVCGRHVTKLNYSARDHCPFCLCSKHVDINPGDRCETCHGILRPIAIEKFKTSQFKIIYRCEKCKKIRKNIIATDDNMDIIIDIMSHPQKF